MIWCIWQRWWLSNYSENILSSAHESITFFIINQYIYWQACCYVNIYIIKKKKNKLRNSYLRSYLFIMHRWCQIKQKNYVKLLMIIAYSLSILFIHIWVVSCSICHYVTLCTFRKKIKNKTKQRQLLILVSYKINN